MRIKLATFALALGTVGLATPGAASTIYGNPNIVLSPDDLSEPGVIDATAEIDGATFRGCGSNPPVATVVVDQTVALNGTITFEPPAGTWCRVKLDVTDLCIDDGTGFSCSYIGLHPGLMSAPLYVDGTTGDDQMVLHLKP